VVLLKALVAILILLFPFGELGRINIYNEVSTTINDIFVAIVLIVWFIWLISTNKFSKASKKQLTKPILFFVLVAFISLILNSKDLKLPEFLASFLYLLRFVSYAGIYFVVSGFSMRFKQKIMMLMIISGSLVVLGGFIQYFLYPDLRNLYYLGWDEHLYRLFSSFLDPNFAASIISLFLILLISLLFLGFDKRYKTRMFLILLSALAFIALFLTYSRSGYLMFLTGVTVLFLILGRKKYIAILLVIFVVGLMLLPKGLGGEGVKLLRTASIISRSEYLDNAITIFKDNPILGVGFNTYRYAQKNYGFIDEFSLQTSHAGAGTDNSFIFVLATTGVIGLVSYLYMWFKIIKGCRLVLVSGPNQLEDDTKEKRRQKIVSIVILASCAGLFVNALFMNSLFYPFVMEWVWVLLGLRESK